MDSILDAQEEGGRGGTAQPQTYQEPWGQKGSFLKDSLPLTPSSSKSSTWIYLEEAEFGHDLDTWWEGGRRKWSRISGRFVPSDHPAL